MSPHLPKQSTDEEIIQREFDLLLDGYIHSPHRKKVEIITRAFTFANEAHKGVRRRSGEPYILHPILVARIVSQEIGLGSTSICAALLHDVVEDTDYTTEDIEKLFGHKIANIVDGLTKISGGIFGDQASAQAENFRKLLLTMSEDIRVVLIKMADRLHNMRTLEYMAPGKQFKIAGETLYIYAPLAHRLGLFAIKTELEDLSFKYEHPEAYRHISEKIAASAANREAVYNSFALPISKILDNKGIHYEMKARMKSIYSIWKKMEAKNIPFEEVYDLYAVRIIFDPEVLSDEKREAWNIYSIITDIYKLHPERTRDWISRPKANGYRALHLTVMGNDGHWVEVQIRSRRMDDIAERGFAAHWKYKEGNVTVENDLDMWLKTVKEILENPEPNALDFLDTIKMNLFSSEIFVFTPKGEIKTLPIDATALDFAFSLHSDVGFHCIAAKVNHNLEPLSCRLNSGDQVEILTSKTQRPKSEWLAFVTTARAKTRLIAALRRERRAMIVKGEKLISAFFEANNIPDQVSSYDKLAARFPHEKRDDLYVKIAEGAIELDEALSKSIKDKENKSIFHFIRNPFVKNSANELSPAPVSEEKTNEGQGEQPPKINRKETYLLRTQDGVKNYVLATCCNPIHGDDVLGYIDEKELVIVHKRQCPLAMKLKSSFGDRIIHTRWSDTKEYFTAQIAIEGIDNVGVLHHITHIISENLSINIRTMHIEAEEGVFHCELLVNVTDVTDVEKLCNTIAKIPEVKSARRIDKQ